MSASEIVAELPKFSREERRRVAAAIFDLEEEADLLRDCVFHLQQIQSVSLNRLETKLGAVTPDEFRILGKQLARLLNLESNLVHSFEGLPAKAEALGNQFSTTCHAVLSHRSLAQRCNPWCRRINFLEVLDNFLKLAAEYVHLSIHQVAAERDACPPTCPAVGSRVGASLNEGR